MAYKILFSFLFLTACAWAQEASPTDEIVIKAADVVMFEIRVNMKLTPEQISAVREIITDNIVKLRNLQQEVKEGSIDGKTMYSQRQKLINEENQALSQIFSPDQMKVWMNMPQSQ